MEEDCCTYECEQGKHCPVRKTCRQRAGKPADYSKVDLWIKDTAELEAELDKQWRSDLKAIVFVASCILAFFLIVLWSTP
jgi:hypothetical protein